MTALSTIFPGGSGGGDVSTDTIWDAKGDIVGGTGADTAAKLAVGTNGDVLIADSTEVTGLKWASLDIVDVNVIGIPGQPGFGVGVCPAAILPFEMVGMVGYDNPMHDNYGNYRYQDGSICCWIPKCYYKITPGTNNVDIKGVDTYANETLANAAGYAMHRAFIDGGEEQPGFFIDKYQSSKNAWGTGQIASSIKNGLPISTHADHNPIADLTACAGNYYYEVINAAHARDGINGAVNASSIWHCTSRFQRGLLALLSLAHAQASSSTTYCAWYDTTYNYPKGCNNNALKDYDEVSNGAGSGDDLL